MVMTFPWNIEGTRPLNPIRIRSRAEAGGPVLTQNDSSDPVRVTRDKFQLVGN